MKSKKEIISFITMNFFGAPIVPIIAGLKWGLLGFTISILLFLISFKVWKYFSKKTSAKLSINPEIKFSNKQWRLFN